MACLLTCQRKHYWRYEVGLTPVKHSQALRFGTAWHTAMEARWEGLNFDEALDLATTHAVEFSEFDIATLAGLLAGYYEHHKNELVASMLPEQEFRFPLPGSRTFDVAGKIDGLGQLIDDRLAMIEHKTAGEEIGPDADYWLRLRFNQQIYQYVSAARAIGHDPAIVLYDATRKPAIRPLEFVGKKDEQGLRIILGADGQRVIKKDGTPKQTADKDKGEYADGAPETPDQYFDRLAADTKARPEFYFARREVPILDQDLAEFEVQRLELSRMILMLRAAGRTAARPEHAWARNCNGTTCRGCEFESFCMQNLTVDVTSPPAGFVVGEKNPELTK
jgi:hypothetical protein